MYRFHDVDFGILKFATVMGKSQIKSYTPITAGSHVVMNVVYVLSSCRDESNHREFKNSCGASLVRFSPESNALVVLVRKAPVLFSCSMLGLMFVSFLWLKQRRRATVDRCSRNCQ